MKSRPVCLVGLVLKENNALLKSRKAIEQTRGSLEGGCTRSHHKVTHDCAFIDNLSKHVVTFENFSFPARAWKKNYSSNTSVKTVPIHPPVCFSRTGVNAVSFS